MTDFLYTAKYIPSRDEESITVGLGGSIDHWDFLYTARYIPSRDEESITVGLVAP